MPYFICPNCRRRSVDYDRREGLSDRPVGCAHCGFGFLFELLDDYYPAPGAAFFTCDKEGRLLDLGKNAFELTGLKDEDAIGRPVRDVLGLRWLEEVGARQEGEAGSERGGGGGDSDPIATTLEWGVRSLGKRVAVHAEGDLPTEAVADVFPAYDDDGGLLLVLTPE